MKSAQKSLSVESPPKSIKDNYESFDDLKQDLKECGLESSRMIIGIDFTASNESKGEKTFNGKSLHYISDKEPNPYQDVISVTSKTLSRFDESDQYLCFGFGDVRTKDHSVFNLAEPTSKKAHTRFNSLEDLLTSYGKVANHVKMSGPTSFSPLIKKAIEVCKSERQYYILIIITDGETTRPDEDAEAIIEASLYPISIICIGVGDGPWDTMKQFDDELPTRKFDNFQFVVYNDVNKGKNKETDFARRALMEIPEQFNAIKKLGYLK
jgi:hypothetical protein